MMTTNAKPHSRIASDFDAEQGALYLMIKRANHDRVNPDLLHADLFHDSRNRIIFEAAQDVLTHHGSIDIGALRATIAGDARFSELAGTERHTYLQNIVENEALPSFFSAYVQNLRACYTLRQIYAVTRDAQSAALATDPEWKVRREQSDQILAELETAVFELRDRTDGSDGGIIGKEQLIREMRESRDRYREGISTNGTPTGFRAFDDATGGLVPSTVTVIGARPGEGKSAIMGNIAAAVAGMGHDVLIFSAEMPRSQILDRNIASLLGVDGRAYKDGRITDSLSEQIDTLAESMRNDWGEYAIDDSPALTIERIRARARSFKRRFPGLKVVFLDYLQLLKTEQKEDIRYRVIGEISQGCKAMAKELGIAVVSLAQLNRQVSKTGDDVKPQLHHLRESGDIEQDADVVALLHWINPEESESDRATAQVDLRIVKNREGRKTYVPMLYNKAETCFSVDLDRLHHEF